MTEIEQKVTLNLEFEVVESENNTCTGCIGDYFSSAKCLILMKYYGSCLAEKRPDKKDVIFKLIENDPTAETNH